jgi:hypothetical protein
MLLLVVALLFATEPRHQLEVVFRRQQPAEALPKQQVIIEQDEPYSTRACLRILRVV